MTNKKHKVVTSGALKLALLIALAAATVYAKPSQKNNLEVSDVKFEPIHQGKNIVQVYVNNNSKQEQTFGIHIQTRSPDYARKGGVGWGRPFFDKIGAGETKWVRCAFHIQGPITKSTWIRLQFYNPASADKYDFERYFKKNKYFSGDLEKLKVEQEPAMIATEKQSRLVIETFNRIMSYIKDKKYKQAWQLFTKDYRDADQINSLERFKNKMEPARGFNLFHWEKNEFLKLKPKSVFIKNNILSMKAVYNEQTWTIDFSQEDGQWKIDWIAGYKPRMLLWQNWEERLLPTMEKRNTKHFDIYYFKDSTAEEEIDQITEQKEKGFRQICRFLGKASDVRICMVFFENGKTKQMETGHQGVGWAYGSTIVEVYNKEQKLDPYHETTHILMRPYGAPPALFNEGFAVYMSELLGAHALKSLSGGLSTIYERARELRSKGEWIELEELITYTEIGSEKSQPPVAYPEAACFVKFLIDKYGKDKFLQSYKALKNSDDIKVHQQNIRKLTNIYGESLQRLEAQWLERIQNGNV